MANQMEENADDFEEYLCMQEERIARIQESLKAKTQETSIPSESKYTTTPLNRYNDRIIEFEAVESKPDRQNGICGGRLLSWSWKKIAFIIVCVVLGSIAIIWVQTRQGEDSNDKSKGNASAESKGNGKKVGGIE
ncbi:hypothetical protein PAEPH01_0649 [Pancytospora epiphaga]|nr:hypothetical protein PAEPH01_0649 [Pancytospora epiphaga]